MKCFLIKGNRGGEAIGCQVGDGCGFELGTGNENKAIGWNHNTQTFRVQEEEEFIFFDGPAKPCTPLIRVGKWLLRAALVVKPVIGFHCGAVPEVGRLAMKSV